MSKLRSRKAFTIVEMVIVIAVIAILAAAIIPTVSAVIQKANVSADTQFAASLNVQLAMWEVEKGVIKNESDLRNAINNYYGEFDEDGNLITDFYASLAPKSGKYGYHYWYDVENRQIVLSTYDKLAGTEVAFNFFGVAFADDVVDNEENDDVITFSPASLRSLAINGKNYFLIDQEGSELADIIVGFENLGDDSKIGSGSVMPDMQYEYIVNLLKKKAEAGNIEEILLSKVEDTAIVTGEGAYRYNNINNVKYVYVPISATIINVQKVYEYVPGADGAVGQVRKSDTLKLATHENVPVVQIPVGVKIASNGFPAMVELSNDDLSNPETWQNVTVLEILASDISEMTNDANEFMFDVQTSNPVFKLIGSTQLYVMINDQPYKLPYNIGDAPVEIEGIAGTGTSQNLNVEVSFPGGALGGNYYYAANDKILYVQYDLSEVPVEVKNGSYVTWEYTEVKTEGEEPVVTWLGIENGKLCINKKIELGENNQIRVTGKINGEEKVSFVVCLVRPTKVTFGELNSVLNSVGAIGEKPVELIYDGIEKTFTFDVVIDYSINNKVALWDVAFASKDGKFDISKNFTKDANNEVVWDGSVTIALDEEYAFEDTLIITVGDDMVVRFAVKAEDRSAADFSVKPIVDINGDGKLTYIDTNDDGVLDTLLDMPIGRDYLFRVGEGNAFAVGNLFYNLDEAADNVCLEVFDLTAGNGEPPINSNSKFTAKVNGTAGTGRWNLTKENWASASLDFDGTGIAKIKIGNVVNGVYTVSAELVVEVVSGKNVTAYSELNSATSYVLLNNITMSEGGIFSITGGTLYGNGFTFDITKGADAHNNRAIISATNATLDNIKVLGATYTQHTNSTGASNPFSSAAISFSGNSEIVNSYVYGCRAPIRATSGTLTIKNTVLEGGRYANIDVQNCTVVLDKAVTIGSSSLGIVINASSTGATITGTAKQYNWLQSGDKDNVPSDYQSVFGEMFKNPDYCHYYEADEKTYVNTGILVLNEENDTVINNIDVVGYAEFNVTYLGQTRQVWTLPDDTYTLKESDLVYRDTTKNPYPYDRDQAYTKPTYTWTYPKEYKEGKITLTVNEGESVSLNPHILTATKYGKSLDVSVSMDGDNYTGDISFSPTVATIYELVYTITDDVIYNAAGDRVTLPEYPSYTKKITVLVNVIAKAAEEPTFTFYYGTKGSSGNCPYDAQPSNPIAGTIVDIAGVKYMSAGTTGGTNIGSKEINGKTIYYPIVDGINVQSGNMADYDYERFYPIFKAVTINDNGTSYSYSATKEQPSTLRWVSEENTGGNGYGLSTDYGLYNNKYWCRKSSGAGNNEAGTDAVVKFCYTARDGKEYTYYVGYKFYDEAENIAEDPCFTPDTLVTLADGTQKRVDEINPDDRILAWDFFTGEYVEKKISLLVNHGEGLRQVIELAFSDGTVLKLIGKHGVFDYDLNKFVYFTPENHSDYIGHNFVKQNLAGGYDIVQLVASKTYEEYTSSWSISSAETSNAFASGMLTVAPPEDFYNWIEMSGKLQYNVEQFAADVEKYGLYTYEDFADYVTPEQFVEWNGAYLKIAVEKGYFTFDYILELIELYKGWMP